jgi:H+-translocating NAD(P) transhydrogenase subunit alpha
MRIGVPREIRQGERRVAATPDTVKRLIKLGFEVTVEAGAGTAAALTDQQYTDAGASLAEGPDSIWAASRIVLKVNPPTAQADGGHEVDRLLEGQLLACMFMPAQNQDVLARAAARGASIVAMDQVPRISRAQKMDVLSSMANIAGYRAVLEAAWHYGGFFGGQMTAAGRTRPAQVLVIGAGVAGLAAIAAARGLGAEVRAFDVRLAAADQCQSLGATFLELDLPVAEGEGAGGYAKVVSDEFLASEHRLFAAQAPDVDIIVTTALIPGRTAPVLITDAMIRTMGPGTVIVDLAAEQGGNCEGTVAGEAVDVHGVTILGYTDMTSRLATHASQFFANNLVNMLSHMGGAEDWAVDFDDEVVRKSTVCHEGQVTWPPPPDPKPVAPPAAPLDSTPITAVVPAGPPSKLGARVGQLIGVGGLVAMGAWAPMDFVQHFTVFVLACFVGWQVVWSVKPALHTPLMSVTNAISGIIIVGGMLQAASGTVSVAAIVGAVAILFASINIFGGFLVTQRMLQMFRREGS